MTWLDLPAGTPYGVDNLPYGVFSTPDEEPRVGVRIGDQVLDLARVRRARAWTARSVCAGRRSTPSWRWAGRPGRRARSGSTELLTDAAYARLRRAAPGAARRT